MKPELVNAGGSILSEDQSKAIFKPRWAEAAFISLVVYLVGSSIAANILYLLPPVFYWSLYPKLMPEELEWARYMSYWAGSFAVELGLIASWTTKQNSFADVFNFSRPVLPVKHLFGYIFGALLLSTLCGYIIAHFFPDQLAQDDDIFTYLLSSPMANLLIFTAVFLGPFSEEVMFRGYLLPAFAKTRLGISGATLLTSATWSLTHYQYTWPGIFSVFVTGIVLSILRIKVGSVWPCILLHGLINLIIMISLMWEVGQI
jgi:membrane protease YdiL (CAAX protease family)